MDSTFVGSIDRMTEDFAERFVGNRNGKVSTMSRLRRGFFRLWVLSALVLDMWVWVRSLSPLHDMGVMLLFDLILLGVLMLTVWVIEGFRE